jgi:hypothetical protein
MCVKNEEFYADFESVSCKISPTKKVISIKVLVMDLCTFLPLSTVFKISLPYKNFFASLLLFQRTRHQILRFLIPLSKLFDKYIFWS